MALAIKAFKKKKTTVCIYDGKYKCIDVHGNKEINKKEHITIEVLTKRGSTIKFKHVQKKGS